MRKLSLVVALVVMSLAASPAKAVMTFDVGENFNFFSDSRVEGQARQFGLTFDISESVDVGVHMERADLQITGDVGATPPNTTKLNYDAMAIRLSKDFTSWLSAGVELGSAKLQQGATSGAFLATAALNQNKPFVGLHAATAWEVQVKDKFTTDFHIGLGYRFLDLNDVAIGGAPAGESTLDDLNALIVNVGFGIGF